jgi:selenocysteine lyase/cysteine desulfurase
MSCGSSTIGIDGVPGAKLKEYLRQKYDAYVPSGRSSLRISTNFFNTFEQCDRVLKALKELSSGVA